jgi:hypothetical protein
MRTLKASVQLERREREFRVKELKRLIAKHQQDPDYRHSCAAWRRELLDVRDEQQTLLPSAGKDKTWAEAKAHAIAEITRQNSVRTPLKSVHEVREAYYAFLREHPFLRG